MLQIKGALLRFVAFLYALVMLISAPRPVKDGFTVERGPDVLTEVNIGCEWSKTGFAYDEITERSLAVDQLPGVNVRGFMAIPPVCETEDEARGYFEKTRRLFEDAKPLFNKPDFDTLSMGMSADYAAAVLEGSTLVRVGSALFGRRRY